MNVSWDSVVFIDMLGSTLTFLIALWCAFIAREWTRNKPDDIFRNYIFLLTIAIVFFAISRSFGHLLKQVLLLYDMGNIWKQISPFSGAINSVTFVVIFSFGIYFHRFQNIHFEIEQYRDHLEEMVEQRTVELEEANTQLYDEITNRKHIEHALNESNNYLQAILDNSTLPICLKDIEGTYVLINKEFEKLAHITNEEIIGKNDFDVFPEPIATLFQAQHNAVKKKNAPVEFEDTIPLNDGEHTFLTCKFPLRDEGVIYAVGGVCTDITHRKKTEEKLAAEQERLAVTLRSIADGVITTDKSGQILSINKVAESLTGWSEDEALGKPLGEVFRLLTKNREHYRAPFEAVLNTGENFTLGESTILVSRQGGEFVIADSGAPIRDKDSNIIGVVIVFRDVTRQIKLEEANLRINKLESVGVLAGGIAHDFNNILTAILGNINLVRLDPSLKDETQNLLAGAEKASLRAKDLTQQLLTFSKGGEPVKEMASLQEVIRDSANFVLHGENVSCNYHFDEDLWLADIDKGQISQVIQNIIINAKQAMPNGGVINVECENILSSSEPQLLPGKSYIKIAISDNGTGIPADILDNIFDPYFSTKSTGSGLGLALCHSIITKHNGHIYVESSTDEGTTFVIFLPASACSIQKQRICNEKITKVRNTKILIMDDEEPIRNVISALLRRLGHDVVVAKDGDEAIQLFRESLDSAAPFDLAILDLTIPGGMGGEEAVKELLKMDSDAKIIVSSGYSTGPIMANYKQYGFCAAIVKPYQFVDLKRVIGEVLG